MRRDCSWVRDRLVLRLDSELAEDERREVERHLAECVACRAEAAELARADVLLRSADPAAEIDDAAERRSLARVLDRLAEEPVPAWAGERNREPGTARDTSHVRRWSWARSPWGIRLRWATGLAVAAVAILLALRIKGPEPRRFEATGPAPAMKAQGTDHNAPPVDRDGGTGGQVPPGEDSRVFECLTERLPDDGSATVDAGEAVADARRLQAPPVTRPPEQRPPVTREKKDEREDAAARAPEEAPPPPALPPAVPSENNRESKGASSGLESQPPSSPEPPPREADAPGRMAVEGRASRLAPEGPTPEELHVRGGRSNETAFRVQEYLASEKAPPDSLAMSFDILREALVNLEAGLERESAPPRERAAGWRTAGDHWEFLARAHDGPPAFDRAARAYERARALDPDIAIDPGRLERSLARRPAPTPPHGGKEPNPPEGRDRRPPPPPEGSRPPGR